MLLNFHIAVNMPNFVFLYNLLPRPLTAPEPWIGKESGQVLPTDENPETQQVSGLTSFTTVSSHSPGPLRPDKGEMHATADRGLLFGACSA